MFADPVAAVEGWNDGGLGVRLRELEVAQRRLEAERAVVLAELERRGVFRADGRAFVVRVAALGAGLVAR